MKDLMEYTYLHSTGLEKMTKIDGTKMCILHCKAPQTIRFTAMVNTSDYFVPFIIIVSFIIVLYLYFMNQVLSSGMRRTCHATVQLRILSEA